MTQNQIKSLVKGIYEARRDRQVNPEGHFDGAGRWYPSDSENAAGNLTSRLRSPSRAWPYSYMTGARTRKHVAVLVARALVGQTVPTDVARAIELASMTQSDSPVVELVAEVA
jgi:hypothetical protein